MHTEETDFDQFRDGFRWSWWCGYFVVAVKEKEKKKYWVFQLIRDHQQSTYVVARQLCSDCVKFKDLFRMELVTNNKGHQLEVSFECWGKINYFTEISQNCVIITICSALNIKLITNFRVYS